MRTPVVAAVAALVCIGTAAHALTEQERKDHVDWMLQSLPASPPWAEWQKKTNALPPDFDALRSANYLPDPLSFQDGRAVRMPSDWPERRKEIRALFEKYVVGTLPPKPKLDRVVAVEESRQKGYSTRVVRLEYGPESKITSEVTLTLPDGPGPFPVLIGGGGWANSLIRRGYAVCEFPSSVDQATNLQELYPGFDFATMGPPL
jgi:hypothetical protein